MSATIHMDNGNGTRSIHFPFEELMAQLKKEGFVIKPDDYIEMLKVTGKFSTTDIHNLRYRLAPIICTNDQEQERFYQVFDEYAKNIKGNDEHAAKFKRKRLLFISGAILALLGLGTLIFFINRKEPPPASFEILVNGKAADVAVPSDTIIADARAMLADLSYDTTGIHVSWDIGKGWEFPDHFSLTIPNHDTGFIHVRLKVTSDKFKNSESQVENNIYICESVIAELRTGNPENINIGSEVTITPVIRGRADNFHSFNWIVNDRDTIRDQPYELHYRVDSSGSYEIKYENIVLQVQPVDKKRTFRNYSKLPSCNKSLPVYFNVEKPNRLDLAGLPTPLQPRTYVNPWLYTLLLVPPLIILINQVLKNRRSKSLKSTIKVTEGEPGKLPTGPVDIPLENNDLKLVTREQEMNTLFRGMRKRIEDESQMLNISKSIHSEILSAGLPTLVFSQRMKQQEFLILTDSSRNNSQQLALFDYLVNVFEEESILVDHFYFTEFTRFSNSAFPEGISLQRLSELYKDHVLLIFGTGYQLLYPHLPVPEPDKMKILGDWDIKAVITPVAYGDWGMREQALKKEFIVLPADIQGQLLLAQAITEKQFQHENYLRTLTGAYKTGSNRLLKVPQIRDYLGNELLFQWLCAIAVYPKLRWEVIIEVGKALGAASGDPNMVNYTNLLRLVRIPWMNQGFIPDATRLELLKHLNRENEAIAREIILNLLTYADTKFTTERFFHGEKEMQHITNAYLLYEYDPGKYKRYEPEAAEFKNRWLRGKVQDGPLVRYLDKREGDDWTNLRDSSDTSTLGNYNSGITPLPKLDNAFYISMGALTLAIIALLFFGKPLLQNLSTGGTSFVRTDGTAEQTMNFNFLLDSCTTDSASFTSGINGSVVLNEKTLPLQFTSWNRATISAPYDVVAYQSALLELSWDNDRQSASKQINLGASNDLIIRSCSDTARQRVFQILYNDPSKRDSVNMIAELLTGFSVEQVVDSNVSSTQLSLTDPDRSLSGNITDWVRTILSQDVAINLANSGTSVLSIYFPRSTEWMPASLPDYLNEVWAARGNNRLITFAIPQRMLWYSTGDKRTYGSYRIEEVLRNGNMWKLILGGNNNYRVMFLRDPRAGSFQMCLVENVFNDRSSAAETDVTTCGQFVQMTESYSELSVASDRGGNKRILVDMPLRSNQAISASYLNRLTNLDETGSFTNRSILYYRNSFLEKFNGQTNENRRMQTVERVLEPSNEETAKSSERFDGTPFDRDYVTVFWSGVRRDLPNQAPVQSNAPPEQQQSQAPVDTTARKQQWQFLARLVIDPGKYNIVKPDMDMLRDVANQLRRSENARLTIVTYYNTAEERKEAEFILTRVVDELNSYGINNTAGRDKVTTHLIESDNDRINQVIEIAYRQNKPTQKRNQKAKTLYADLYGVGITRFVRGY